MQVICFHRFCVEIFYMLLLLLLLSSADNLWCVSNHICCSHVLCVERMNNYLRLFHNSYSFLMLLFNFMLPQWSNQFFFFLHVNYFFLKKICTHHSIYLDINGGKKYYKYLLRLLIFAYFHFLT